MGAITGIIDKISELLKIKFEQLKLEAQGQMAYAISRVIGFVVVFALASLSILFLAIGLAFFLNSLVGNTYGGFFIMGGALALVTILIFLFAKSGRLASALEEAILKETEKEE